jgi:DNA-binding winged helix-turn-helix (wHTH) protein
MPMTPIEHDHLAPSAKRLRFDRYVLDLDRDCLLLDDSEIILRPKTFAVLHFLVENSGRLVSKEDLFAAVWPNIAVTDDVLVQSIGELRRALLTTVSG